MKKLRVVVDGQDMGDDDARAFWQRFSAYMDEHKGDLAGFAQKEGFASVHPGLDDGTPILRVSRTAVQGPYVNVSSAGSKGGSTPRQAGGSPRPGGPRRGGKTRRR